MIILKSLVFVTLCAVAAIPTQAGAAAPWMLSGNDNKIELATGTPLVERNPEPDSVSILDFSKFPPAVRHLPGIPNTVLGPPSNIAVSPDGVFALVASAIKIDPRNPTNWVPDRIVRVLNIASGKVTQEIETELQPSGICFAPNGKIALVANRASGSITILAIEGAAVKKASHLKICEPQDSLSDIAITPDGLLAFASLQKAGYVAVLEIAGDLLKPTWRKLSVFGQPYRCLVTPDGELGLVAGIGVGNGGDHDAISLIDLRAAPMRTIGYVTVGAVPESMALSPDGRLLAVVCMNGSSLARDNPFHSRQGTLEILARNGKSFGRIQSLPLGPIPQGVEFTADGKYLVVQSHPRRELSIFKVEGDTVRDTTERVMVPGRPSSLRSAR